MIPEKKQDNDPAAENPMKNPIWNQIISVGGLRTIFIIASILIVAVIVISQRIDDKGDSANVLVVGILSIVSLVVVIISTASTREMVDIMRSQEAEATRQRETAQAQEKRMIEQRDIMQKQLEAMHESAEGVEQTLIYSQRAYVTADIDKIDPMEYGCDFWLRVENGGNTPANAVTICYNIELREEPPECCLPHKPEDMIVWDIGACKNIGIVAARGSSLFPISFHYNDPADEEKWRKGENTLYCWGAIKYTDIFRDGRRRSTFAFFQSADYRRGYPCEGGNEAY